MSVAAFGGTVVRYPLRPENGLNPDPDEVAALITPRTKLLVLNSPGNPTGAVAPPGDLERLVSVARGAGVLVVSDEVYDEIVFEGLRPHTLVPIDPDWVVGLWSCSKTYAMTGWRVGYTAVPSSIVGALTRIQESMITCVSSVTQAAALAAFTGPQECVAEMCAAYQRRRDLLMGLLDAAGFGFVRPLGAFYLMMSLRGDANSRLAALDLVDDGVAVAPGTAFGDMASSALRISLAASEATISAAAQKLIDWYARTDGGLSVS
jgi:aspartate/methionine/tyrosine aminotransferase